MTHAAAMASAASIRFALRPTSRMTSHNVVECMSSPLWAGEPCIIARIERRGLGRAVMVDRRSKRAAGGQHAKRHMAVGGGKAGEIRGSHHGVERFRRLHRVEAILLVDRGALDD